MVRSISVIGALWPLCIKCKHAAQSHADAGCCEPVTKQCPTCKQHGAVIECGCPEYQGPTWDQFKKDYLTPEEIAHYKWSEL
jgi:hypothetical protein